MPTEGFSATGLRRLHDVPARHVDSGRIPGLVALVGRGDETHVETLGTTRHDGGAPVRRDTVFRMASTFGLGMDMTSLGTPVMNAISNRGSRRTCRSRCPNRTSGCAASARSP